MAHQTNMASVCSTIAGFLHRAGGPWRMTGKHPYDDAIRARVREQFQVQLTDLPAVRFDKHLQTATLLITSAYGHLHLDVQVHITILSLLLLAVDDLDVPFAAMDEFAPRFLAAMPQLSPTFEALAENLRGMADFYPPHAVNGIVTSTLASVNTNALHYELRDSVVREGAENYVSFCRIQDGICQAYFYLIWDKATCRDVFSYIECLPDAMVFIGHVNDILSFYKEELGGEDCNVVRRRATASGKPVDAVLRQMVDEANESIARCRALLSGKERQAFERFMTGYTAFHYIAPRYRLHEIVV